MPDGKYVKALVSAAREKSGRSLESFLASLPDDVRKIVAEQVAYDTFVGEQSGEGEPDSSDKWATKSSPKAASDPQIRRLLPDGEKGTKRIGPFKILQPIGKGGMGQVFMAEQLEPVRRRVALKVIKTDTPSKEILARFEAERQALAMMDHQNIAKVLDAGITEGGLPYFAMELVKGVPITKYCDVNKLAPKERLELFIQACRAIQHAHQKGIVHRDIKPSNMLVTLYDGKPVTKVIDFGLAKALNDQARLTDHTMFTRLGQVVGTLEYMSPEQAEMNALDIDTRTDVYSLGVILYELLTGSTPIGRQRLKTAALDQILRLIREEDAPRPSSRLSESGEAITGISLQRRTDPKRLSLLLKGDLDWIAMKALEKDRTRRYDGPSALADDVQRFLDDEAVEARPPSLRYQLSKSYRRHRVEFVSASVLFALLISGLISTGWMYRRARAESIRANIANTELEAQTEELRVAQLSASQRAREAEEARNEAARRAESYAELAKSEADAREKATRLANDNALLAQQEKEGRQLAVKANENLKIEADKARRLSEFLIRTFQAYDPIGQGAAPGFLPIQRNDLTAREMLDASAQRVIEDQELAALPLSQAAVMQALGDAYRQLGLFEKAYPLLHESLEIRRERFKDDPLNKDLAQSCHSLAWYFHEKGDYPRAKSLYEEALRIRRTMSGDEGLRLTAATLYNIAWMLGNEGWGSEAEEKLRECLDIRRQVLGKKDRDTVMTRLALVCMLFDNGKPIDAALQLGLVMLNSKYLTGNDKLKKAAFTFSIGVISRQLRLLVLSEYQLKASLQACDAGGLGVDHIYAGVINCELGYTLEKLGRLEEAEAEYAKSLKIAVEKVKLAHPRVGILINRYADLLADQGRQDEGKALWNEFLAGMDEQFPPLYGELLSAKYDYAYYLQNIDELEESQAMFGQVADGVIKSKSLGLQNRYKPALLGHTLNQQGLCVMTIGKDLEEAKRLFRESLAAFGSEDLVTSGIEECAGWPMLNLAGAQLNTQELEAATRTLSDARRFIDGLPTQKQRKDLMASWRKLEFLKNVRSKKAAEAIDSMREILRLTSESAKELIWLAEKLLDLREQALPADSKLERDLDRAVSECLQLAIEDGYDTEELKRWKYFTQVASWPELRLFP